MLKFLAFTSLIVFSQPLFAQQPHQLPFASAGNVLELTVANTSAIVASNITVEATNIPSWLNMTPASASFTEIKPNEELLASFAFSIDKSAPVNSVQTLNFVITNSRGEQWTKEISISVKAPESFELFQNFPNPFNPATTISYQLAQNVSVSLRIYDILGREVTALVNAEQPAGYHQEVWDASRYSSGMYVYQMLLTDQHNKRQAFRKTMLVVK